MLNWLLALASAALLILTFPKFSIVWFAPVALTPLLVAMAREPRWPRRFLLAWSAGVVYWFGVCYWIQFVLAFHGGLGDAAGWAVFLLFCVAKAIHMGVFGALAGVVMRRWWAAPSVAALWVAVEATHGSLGFAWLALGNAGIDMGIPMRLAPYTGVYGLSFVFALMAAALAMAVMRRPRVELLWLAPILLLMLLPQMPPAGARARNGAAAATQNIGDGAVDRGEYRGNEAPAGHAVAARGAFRARTAALDHRLAGSSGAAVLLRRPRIAQFGGQPGAGRECVCAAGHCGPYAARRAAEFGGVWSHRKAWP